MPDRSKKLTSIIAAKATHVSVIFVVATASVVVALGILAFISLALNK